VASWKLLPSLKWNSHARQVRDELGYHSVSTRNAQHGADDDRAHILPESVTLKHKAIPHAAIPNCTNHFSLVNTLWESEVDLACSIEGFQLFGGENEIQTGEIVLELRYLPRSDDWDYWHRLMAQPG